MGLVKKTREAVADSTAEEARQAWEQGDLAYVVRLEAMSSNRAGRINPIVNAVMRVGWKLHSTAAVFNTVGLNTEVVFFTFTRD